MCKFHQVSGCDLTEKHSSTASLERNQQSLPSEDPHCSVLISRSDDRSSKCDCVNSASDGVEEQGDMRWHFHGNSKMKVGRCHAPLWPRHPQSLTCRHQERHTQPYRLVPPTSEPQSMARCLSSPGWPIEQQSILQLPPSRTNHFIASINVV